MKPNDMHKMAHAGCHSTAPKAWHGVPVATGDYDLDATIMHTKNRDLPKRLNLYLKTGGKAFGGRTAYNGYHGNSGDD